MRQAHIMEYKIGDIVYCINGPFDSDKPMEIVDTNGINKYLCKVTSTGETDWLKDEHLYKSP